MYPSSRPVPVDPHPSIDIDITRVSALPITDTFRRRQRPRRLSGPRRRFLRQ